MTYLNPRELKDRSRQILAPVLGGARRVALIYTAVLVVLSLASSGLQLYLDAQIGGTGGLGGLGLRSVLQTIKECLSYGNMFFGPFWSAGFLYAMLRLVRGGAPKAGDLTAGFRKFLRVFTYVTFQALAAIAVITVTMQLATTLFFLTPWGAEFTQILTPILSDPNILTAEGVLNMELLPLEILAPSMIPLFIIFGLLFLVLYTWLGYGFRLALYLVMEGRAGGTAAHFLSMKLMKGYKWQMLKLDLSYWWYYLLQLLASLAAWLDVILLALGVELPFDATAMYFITLLLYGGLLMGLNVWKKCEVDCVYLAAYEAIAHPAEKTE